MRSQRVAVALAAGEHADALENVVCREQETAEQAAQFGLGGARRELRRGRRACARPDPAPCIDPARSNPASTLWPSVKFAAGQRLGLRRAA